MRVLVDRARDQILSYAAFAAEQHGGIRGRDALDQRQHGLHFRAVRDDVVVLVSLAERLAQRAILLAKLVRVEFLADHQHQFGERERLQDVVAGAGLHRFHGGFDGAVGGHHDDGQVRVDALGGLQEFEAVHSRQLEIGDDQVELFLAEQLQAGFGVGGGVGVNPLRRAAARADGAFWLRLRRSGWMVFRSFFGFKNRNKIAIRQCRRSLF